MGLCVSKVTRVREGLYAKRFGDDDPHSFLVSRRIEKQLRNQEQEDRHMIKLLLLGSGNSGKSTVMKQFKIIHKRGFTTDERRVFRDALWKSAIESMRSLVRARQDYINAMHLDDPSFDPNNADDEHHHERSLIDPSMEPYFQFLLFRVRNEQPLYEELIIPVAAESSPRAEALSPPRTEPKQFVAGAARASTISSTASTGTNFAAYSAAIAPAAATSAGKTALAGDGGGGSVEGAASAAVGGKKTPLLTSTTIVLSSPPPPERKSIRVGNPAGSDGSDSFDGLRAEPIPEAPLDGEGEGESPFSSHLSEHDNGLDLGTTETPATPATPSFAETPSSGDGSKKKKKKKSSSSSSRKRQAVTKERAASCSSSSADGKTGATVAAYGLENGSKLVDSAAFDASLEDGSPQEGAATPLKDASFASRSKEGSFVNEVGEESKALAAETLPAGEEGLPLPERRKKSKKSKKEKKSKRKQFLDDTSASVRSDNRKLHQIISASSVGSLRSEGSKTAAGQKASAPLVTWERLTIGRLLQKIWMDPLIQRVWAAEEKSPQLEAPVGYIMNAMDRIAEEGFQPTNEDILFARKRTSGVNLLDFEAYGAKFLLIDVGGQRTERKKWLAHFDIVHAVIFVVGLDQYDQVMMEDGITNRLKDSLELFEEMCSSPWFRNSSFLLFLNKSDVFKTKIKQVPLTVCFRGYQGDPHDYDQCTKYIVKRFQQIHTQHANLYRDSQPQRMRNRNGRHATPHVYPYMTNATDTESMRFVIDTCQDILLRSEMAQWGFFDF